MIFIVVKNMGLSYKQIIRRILKEENMGEMSMTQLLEWYETWNDKLNQSVEDGDYTMVMNTHLKSGFYLLSTLKNTIKNNPDYKEKLEEELYLVRSKMIMINNARKLIDGMR